MQSLKKDSLWLVCFVLAVSLILETNGQVTQTLPALTSSVVVVEGATLIDGTGAAPTPGTTLVIEDGRILQIGRRGEVPIPAGAQVL
jgi:imidazolonepropionase-like amidohydrolase